MIRTIADFAEDAEAGVGLALQDDEGRYLFFLAGTRHRCPQGERFYAGIGGHREEGEDWLACAHREALEEVGADVQILSAPVTWYLPQHGSIQRLKVRDQPRPFAFYEMIHPPWTPRDGELYRLVIYRARLCAPPRALLEDELLGVIALSPEQVVRGPDRKPTLATLIEEGAGLLAGGEALHPQMRLYPLGTAVALAHVLHHSVQLKQKPGQNR